MTPDTVQILTSPGLVLLSAWIAAAGAMAAQLSGPVSCAWPATPDHLLHRLQEVRTFRAVGQVRRTLGRLLLASLLAAGATLAYAAQPSAPDRLPSEVVGVVGSGNQLGLKIAIDHETRTLSPGDEYRDGWTLKAITPSTATLVRGAETRVVGLNLNGAAGAPAQTAPSQVVVNSQALKDAIAAGDVARIMQLKGSPMDVIAAEKAILSKDPNALLSPARTIDVGGAAMAVGGVPLSRWMTSMDATLAAGHQPVFINDNGRNLMAIPNDEGRLDGFTTVPGMNEPGAALVGTAYHVPTPAEIMDKVDADRAAAGLPVMPRLPNGLPMPPASPPPPPAALISSADGRYRW